jgi:hypothetical protein
VAYRQHRALHPLLSARVLLHATGPVFSSIKDGVTQVQRALLSAQLLHQIRLLG